MSFVQTPERPNRNPMIVLVISAMVIAVSGCANQRCAEDSTAHSPYKSVFVKPPTPLPVYQQTDAPLMGNGDMAVALSGEAGNQQFWLSKNDLWELRPLWCMSGPRPLGHLDVRIPLLDSAFYRVEQDLSDATTTATFKGDKTEVIMRSWVCATENLLVVEMTAQGDPVEGDVDLWIPAQARTSPMSDHRPKHGTASDWDGMPAVKISDDGAGTYWGERGFRENVEVPAATACAFHLLGRKETHFTLEQGAPVTLVASMRSLRQGDDYVSQASKRIASLHEEDLKTLYGAHCKWWGDFWGKSSVELGNPELEWRYHVSNYILGSCSRDPNYPPGIAGTWVTTDQPMWTGAYTLNYNHEACFYGLYSSNHIEQADPEDAPVLDFMKRGQFYARTVCNCRGVLYPVKIGPVGVETTADPAHPNTVTKPDDPPWLRQNGGLFLGQKSDAAFAAVNMAQRWYTTCDTDYGKKVYPFVREVARFWSDYLKLEPTPPELIQATADLPEGLRQPADGRYVDYNDGANEGGQDTNPTLSLALIRNTVRLAIDLSSELGQDNEEREAWQRVLAHLSGYPTQEFNGKLLFRRAEKEFPPPKKSTAKAAAGATTRPKPKWGTAISPIYPSGCVGLGSDPRLLEAARNSFTIGNNWVAFNGESSFFPTAARIGYEPDILRGKLLEMAFHPNGVVINPAHMLENSSIVPNTIDEMLMQSHEGTIRLFPAWPRHRDAGFHTLRAYGAFLISAGLKNGVVRDVTILSEKGRPCTVQNPWPASRVQLICDGKQTQTVSGNTFKFNTAAGDLFQLVPLDLR